MNKQLSFETTELKQAYDYLAPDGSEIRLLPSMTYGSMAHCVLPPGKVTKAVKHKTVEEIWFVIEGEGEIWRKNEAEEAINILHPGVSISIPVGTSFQFRSISENPLKILLATMPPWPGKDEAVSTTGIWPTE